MDSGIAPIGELWFSEFVKHLSEKPRIDVVCALIREPAQSGRVLVARRLLSDPHLPGMWEFPGGKIEEGETPSEAVVREIEEEFGVRVGVLGPFGVFEHEYPAVLITLYALECEVSPDASFVPVDHEEWHWMLPFDMHSLDWAAADLPIVNALLRDQSRSVEVPVAS